MKRTVYDAENNVMLCDGWDKWIFINDGLIYSVVEWRLKKKKFYVISSRAIISVSCLGIICVVRVTVIYIFIAYIFVLNTIILNAMNIVGNDGYDMVWYGYIKEKQNY